MVARIMSKSYLVEDKREWLGSAIEELGKPLKNRGLAFTISSCAVKVLKLGNHE
jgi:hypothetical protein